MNEKTKMINLVKEALKAYQVVASHETSTEDDKIFAYNKLYFYLKFVKEIYPDLKSELPELYWITQLYKVNGISTYGK